MNSVPLTSNTPVIGIVGLGLIGGSLAKTFRRYGFPVKGVDTDESVVRSAVREKAVSGASVHPDILRDADFIFVALYPSDVVAFVRRHYGAFKKGTVVVDCCGIKQAVCAGLDDFCRVKPFYFIGGHPMAGTEKNGFSASSDRLFENAPFLLTPPDWIPPAVVENTIGLVKTIGFQRAVVTTPRNHDRMIAFTSQLPHVLACAYVKSPCCPLHDGYSAGSFNDVSRVAHINAPMWAQLFIDNRTELAEEIDLLVDHITQIRDAAVAADFDRLAALLAQAREIKDRI